MTTNNIDLNSYGITNATEVIRNPSYDQLFEEETYHDLKGYEVGTITELNAVSVDTGDFTGRSPRDKYFVLDDTK